MKVLIFGFLLVVIQSITCGDLVPKNIITYVASDPTTYWYYNNVYTESVEVFQSTFAYLKGSLWIWNNTDFSYNKETTVTFVKIFNIPGTVNHATLKISVDDIVNFALINNINCNITSDIFYYKHTTFYITNGCLSGRNNLTISVKNRSSNGYNPAGLSYMLIINSTILG